jgi:hypothetical protein
MRIILRGISSLIIAVFAPGAFGAITPLPEGNTGIATHYPGDSGITSNGAVIFADNFESYSVPNDLWKTYYNVFQLSGIRFAQEAGNVFSGSKSLEFTLPKQTAELSNGVQMQVSPQREVLFLRYYSKFDTTFDITGSCHNGGGISAHYFNGYNSTPGVPSDGYNKFLIEFECWRGDSQTANPGQYNVYVYHPGQRSNYGDHFFPNGEVMPNTSLAYDFGPDFVSRPSRIPQLGRWYCHEVMLKANTVGAHDGRIACWIDGVLVADFQNLELRKVDSLKIDRFNVSFHAGSNPVRATRKWYDNIVAATSYIGPMVNTNAVKSGTATFVRSKPALFTVCNVKGQVVGRFKGEYRGSNGSVSAGQFKKDLPRGIYVLVVGQGSVKLVTKTVIMR